MAGKLPDFDIMLRLVDDSKYTQRYTKVGAAWWNRDRTGITMRLNPGTVIDRALLSEFTFGLFERRDQGGRSTQQNSPNADVGDEDMPF